MRRLSLAGCLIMMCMLVGCSNNRHLGHQTFSAEEGQKKDNLGTIGKILRTADHARVLRDYATVKNNDHDSEQLEKVLNEIDELVDGKEETVMIDVRIGNYGDVEVRNLFQATSDSLIGIRADKDEIQVIKIEKDKKSNEWNQTNAIDNEKVSDQETDSFVMEKNHGLYVMMDAKLENIRNGKCLGEVNGKTYVLIDDGYGREILYVIGCYENKRSNNDWDMNIVQFISSDGTFKDNIRDVYNVENAFIYKDGCKEVKDEAIRVINLYPGNGLQKNVKKAFK